MEGFAAHKSTFDRKKAGTVKGLKKACSVKKFFKTLANAEKCAIIEGFAVNDLTSKSLVKHKKKRTTCKARNFQKI
jgi:hypothetical protein